MLKTIAMRRSIRKFQAKDVPVDHIKKMLEAAMVAPSGKNRQPWKYIVFKGAAKEEMLEKMELGIKREAKNSHIVPGSQDALPDAYNTLRAMREASCVILIINTNGESSLIPLIDSDERFKEQCDLLSIGASIENMVLTAVDLGLGTLWVGNTCYAYPELTKYLKIHNQLVGALAVGYPDEFPHPRPRKNFEEVVEFRVD